MLFDFPNWSNLKDCWLCIIKIVDYWKNVGWPLLYYKRKCMMMSYCPETTVQSFRWLPFPNENLLRYVFSGPCFLLSACGTTLTPIQEWLEIFEAWRNSSKKIFLQSLSMCQARNAQGITQSISQNRIIEKIFISALPTSLPNPLESRYIK